MENTNINISKVSFFRSIQGQLVVWFMLLGLLPLTVIGVITFLNAQQSLRQLTGQTLEGVVEMKRQTVDEVIMRWQDTVTVTSKLDVIRGDTRADSVQGLGDLLLYRRNVDAQQQYQGAYDDAYQTLTDIVTGFEGGESAVLIAHTGEVLISTDPSLIAEGTKLDQEAYFQEGLKGLYTSDIIDDPRPERKGEHDMVFSHAVVDPSNGQTSGVVAIRINFAPFETLMQERTGMGATGETYLVHLDDQRMLTKSRFEDRSTVETALVDTEAVRQAMQGVTEGIARYPDYRNQPVMGAWRKVGLADWVLIGEKDVAEVDAPANDLGGVTLIIAILSLVVIAVTAYGIARSISRPLNAVTNSTARMAAGALDERVKVNSRNEVGLLADSFNSMADNLQQMMDAERQSKAYLENVVTTYNNFVHLVADGNLASRLPISEVSHSEDGAVDDLYQLGVNLNQMVESLSKMAGQIRETATNVSAAAAEILAATTQQIAGATEQDAAVTQTMATVDEVRITVKQTAERAQTVADQSRQSVEVSRNGQGAVIDSITGMKNIRERVESIAENILALSERTQQIGEIIDTVNEIANQSKLLALNASIEAARAGEEGKGFAVVAMEVRQLAEQSREATARVRDILNQIQQATNTAVMVTEEGSKGAESGMGLVERAGEAIRELTATIEGAMQAATQIAASTHQQTNGMDQLALAMASIKQTTTQNAVSTRQAERSAQDLNEMSRRLEQAVARYQLN